jgi:hypothetical protein
MITFVSIAFLRFLSLRGVPWRGRDSRPANFPNSSSLHLTVFLRKQSFPSNWRQHTPMLWSACVIPFSTRYVRGIPSRSERREARLGIPLVLRLVSRWISSARSHRIWSEIWSGKICQIS